MQANETDPDLGAQQDLGPLAWVLEELRKSLEAASAALRRFVRDTAAARGSDMASVDTSQLRVARQQLHQAVGALEMVGMGAPAHMLRCMEAAVQKFLDKPESCNEAAASKVERAGFALTEYLEAVLSGKAASAVALFPQYRDVQELAGADRVHPADLWAMDWRWLEPDTPPAPQAMVYDPALRSRMDQAVLRIVKSGDAAAARELADVSIGLAGSQTARQPKSFWKISAGYFEALAAGQLPSDIYVKRAASRILLQYASLAKGELGVSDRLAQDLVFFCAQASDSGAAPLLAAVRKAYGLARHKPVDYMTAQFGRFDPVLLTQVRKRIATVKETWSSLSGGDAGKLKNVGDQFEQLGDALSKLHAPGAPLAQAMQQAVDAVVRSGRPPGAELAMEVATAVLYLEAVFHDLDPDDAQLPARMTHLAGRLDRVRQGGQSEALESWMEDLYRRVSDRQTMGSVVGELRGTMGELEKLLDQFFRNPAEKTPLREAPGHLAQMRGVLSVLGLDQAAHAVQRMREGIEEILDTEIDVEQARAAGTFDKLGNNLGAMGFLIDMLNYQPALAKKLFVYDDANGELKPLMGRAARPAEPAEEEGGVSLSKEVRAVVAEVRDSGFASLSADKLDALASQAVLAQHSGLAQSAREAAAAVSAQDSSAATAALNSLSAALAPAAPAPAPAPAAAPADDIEEDDLRDIFLEEAREVNQNGLAALDALAANPTDVAELTTLRRAFHTLKGSSRMVGLSEFGEGAWAMEQVLNTWLADQKPATDELRSLATGALKGFGRWIEDIANNNDGAWKAGMFRGPADAMRTEQKLLPFLLPGDAAPAEPPMAAPGPAAPAMVFEMAQGPEPTIVLRDEPAPAEPVPAAPLLAEPPSPVPQPPVMELSLGELPSLDLAPPLPAAAPVAQAPVKSPFESTVVIRPEPAQPADAQVSELPADFEFDMGTPAEPATVPVTAPAEIEGIDFASLSAVSGTPVQSGPQPPAQPVEEPPAVSFEEFEQAQQAAAPVEPVSDEPVKVIGSLRIPVPLYNVYLNEADEWSRRLQTEVAEWALELNQPVPDSTVGLAHALAGSSATVGFHALSDIARALENELQHAQPLAYWVPQHGKTFGAAAEEIRRLLHQFAAGFLKEPDAQVTQSLLALRELNIPIRTDMPDSVVPADAADDLDFAAAEPAPLAPPQPPAPPAETAAAMPAPLMAAAPALAAAPRPAAAPVPQRVGLGAEDEDDLDVVDAVDPDLFPIFEEEAVELLPRMDGALRQWAAQPGHKGGRDQVLRDLHTLKGSARLAGALKLGEMAHRMESSIESLGSENVGTADLETLQHSFDQMQGRFEALRATGGQPPAPARAVAAMPSQAAPAAEAAARAPLAPLAQKIDLPMPAATSVVARPGAGAAVRVRSQLLDRLMNQAGEVMITRTRLEAELKQLRGSLNDLTGNLERLRAQLRDIELQAESQMQSRMAQAKDSAAGFDPLEFDRFTRVQELTRMMAESVNDVATVQRNLQRTVESTEDDLIAQARQTRELQRDLLRTRMVEFEGISDRLYRVVRLASKETGKQVKLDITGGSIEMDRGVLDRMTPAFEHLLRNCVAHGIEEPMRRTAAGKDASGSIVIGLHQEGNDVSVEFRDDGAGLNLPRIREKALQQGLVAPGQEISDAEAANLIFMPGFSTAQQVTELAGRGIGMDVVRAEVNALGGRIETATEAGKGTSFKLVLPLTTAVTQVVMIRVGSLMIGVPANLVEIVRRAPAKEVEQAYAGGSYEFSGEQLPFFWAGALLQASARSLEPQGKTSPVVIFRSAAQRVAAHVDEVLGNQEVVVKNLGPQLSRLPGLAGMTVLASGAVVLIYNPVALTQVYGEQARQFSAERAQPAEAAQQTVPAAPGQPAAPQEPAAPQIPLVLVVDDSITVRRVTQRLLQREGYRVSLAADGLQALERLAEEIPTVVLSDIEMPRMDGFDLARNIRVDPKLKHLPIIMITSRIAAKHREHAMELGVNHYLGKPFSEDDLLSLIKHYSVVAQPA